MRAHSVAFAACFARFSASLALSVSCCAKPADVRFSSMLLLLLAASARSRIQAAVPSAWPRMTPASTRVVVARPGTDVVRAPKSEEALTARARHRHAAQALAQLGGNLLHSADAPGQELSRM
eukprot:4280265-Pleurochrysis_carterae.AAC.1